MVKYNWLGLQRTSYSYSALSWSVLLFSVQGVTSVTSSALAAGSAVIIVHNIKSGGVVVFFDMNRVFSEFRFYGIPYVFLNSVYSL